MVGLTFNGDMGWTLLLPEIVKDMRVCPVDLKSLQGMLELKDHAGASYGSAASLGDQGNYHDWNLEFDLEDHLVLSLTAGCDTEVKLPALRSKIPLRSRMQAVLKDALQQEEMSCKLQDALGCLRDMVQTHKALGDKTGAQARIVLTEVVQQLETILFLLRIQPNVHPDAEHLHMEIDLDRAALAAGDQAPDLDSLLVKVEALARMVGPGQGRS